MNFLSPIVLVLWKWLRFLQRWYLDYQSIVMDHTSDTFILGSKMIPLSFVCLSLHQNTSMCLHICSNRGKQLETKLLLEPPEHDSCSQILSSATWAHAHDVWAFMALSCRLDLKSPCMDGKTGRRMPYPESVSITMNHPTPWSGTDF